MISIIFENKEWLFSGFGIACLGIVWRALSGKKSNRDSNNAPRKVETTFGAITTGDNSTNIQSKGNVTVSIENGKVQKSD